MWQRAKMVTLGYRSDNIFTAFSQDGMCYDWKIVLGRYESHHQEMYVQWASNDWHGAWVRRWWGIVSHPVWNHYLLLVFLFNLFSSATTVIMHLGISFVSLFQAEFLYCIQATLELNSSFRWNSFPRVSTDTCQSKVIAGNLCHRMFKDRTSWQAATPIGLRGPLRAVV